jgi:ABC-type dipeptide/oligopeptide/nickel transport system permease subunit
MIFGHLIRQNQHIMVKKILILTVVIFSMFSCSVDDNNNFEIETLPVKTAEVPDAFVFGNTYTLTITYDLPSNCHTFFELFYQHEGSSRIVAVNSLVNTNLACNDEVTEIEYSFEVRAIQVEDYTFKFWKGKDNSGNDIFEEVVVPVTQ